MDKETIVVERRRHERFQVKNGVLAALRINANNKLGKIIDMSKGGLAFRYIYNEEWTEANPEPDQSFDLVTIVGEDNFFLEDLPLRTVSDCVIAKENSFKLITMRQRSMQFGELTPEQMARLEIFIKSHTLSES